MSSRKLVFVSLALLASPCAFAQEKQPEPPVIHVPVPHAADDLHQQMLDLIGKVEARLRGIDKLLAEASTPPRSPAEGGAHTAELVRRSQEESKSVIEGIDKILELANTPHHPPASGSGS